MKVFGWMLPDTEKPPAVSGPGQGIAYEFERTLSTTIYRASTKMFHAPVLRGGAQCPENVAATRTYFLNLPGFSRDGYHRVECALTTLIPLRHNEVFIPGTSRRSDISPLL